MEDKRKRCCHLPNLLFHPCVPVMRVRRVENLHFNHGHFKHTNTCTFCPSLPGSPGDSCGSGAGVGPGGPGGPLGPGSPRSPFKPCLGWPWEMTQRLQCCCLKSLIKMVMKMENGCGSAWCHKDAPLWIVPPAPLSSVFLQSVKCN